LIRVLNHEIMNSVTPIISLSGILKDKLIPDEKNKDSLAQLSAEDVEDVQQSLLSIESRSKGLNRFVQTYRRLTSIPAPSITKVKISNIIDNVRVLMAPELEKRHIDFIIKSNVQSMIIDVDQQQIEQVLINLIKNAIEALVHITKPIIRIELSKGTNDSLILKIIDNGLGIERDILDQVFVPFFTTKENGSGIGLSISRQLMIQNKGSLTITSTLDEGCVLMLRFQKVFLH
jgi:two-component system nitrogen regulation sensor histidine kinase NtrY